MSNNQLPKCPTRIYVNIQLRLEKLVLKLSFNFCLWIVFFTITISMFGFQKLLSVVF